MSSELIIMIRSSVQSQYCWLLTIRCPEFLKISSQLLSFQKGQSQTMRVFLLLSILTFAFAKGENQTCGLADEILNLQHEVEVCKDCSSNLCQQLNISSASSQENVCYWNERSDMCLSSKGKFISS